MTDTVPCALCGEQIAYEDVEDSYRLVVGWEKRRAQGGTNALRLRKPQEVFAHFECVEKEAHGVAAGQQGLSV